MRRFTGEGDLLDHREKIQGKLHSYWLKTSWSSYGKFGCSEPDSDRKIELK